MKVYNSNSAFDILELIQKNPERYLSDKSIIALQDFINGYLSGNPYPDDQPSFWDFDTFLLGKSEFEYNGGNRNLISRILMNECNQDEYESFNRFFKYLELYKKKASL